MKIKSISLVMSVLSSALLALSMNAFAQSISMYDQPAANAKVVGTADLATGVIPIFTPKASDWIKIADPRNGNVGWIKSSDLTKAKTNTGSVVFTQKIISGESAPGTYQVLQFGTPRLTNDEAKDLINKVQRDQQMIQNSFQNMMQNMNNLFQYQMNQWNAQWNNINNPQMMPLKPSNTSTTNSTQGQSTTTH